VSPREFVAESLLNLSKVLEVVYGPRHDDVRAALGGLGFDAAQIERDFIPVMILRNSLDVGHPSLALLTRRQLETLHRYADRAEGVFRGLLQRIVAAAEVGRLHLPEYELGGADANTRRTIETIQSRLAEWGDRP
jgi:hypothetical protein